MGRPGFAVSQEGIPIDRAADYQRVLDDRWPYIDIVHEGEVVVDKKSWGPGDGWWIQELHTHDLGYIPAFTYRVMDVSGDDEFRDSSRKIIATDRKIYALGFYSDGDALAHLYERGWLRILNVDITREFRFNFSKASPRTRISEKRYGLKVVNPNKPTARINDTEMSGFSTNTNAKALAVQQTGLRTAASPDYQLVIEHNMGYPPTYFLAQYLTVTDWVGIYPRPLDGEAWCYPLNSEIIGKTSANTATLTVEGAQAQLEGTWAFIIAKDPAEVAA